MNARKLYTYAGLGALSLALVALPGSARKQGSMNSSQADLKARIQELQSSAQELQGRAQELQEVVPLESLMTDGPVVLNDDDDIEVFKGPHGSWLGVSVAEVTSEEVKERKLPAERGAVVGKVVPDSPAAKAGLKQNDVITEINGQRIEGTAQFRRMIREIPAGRTAQFTVWRDGHSQNISVTLGKSETHLSRRVFPPMQDFTFPMSEWKAMPDMGELRNFAFSFSGQPRLGIDAENLEGDFGKYFGAPDGEGVLVREVFADSAAAKAGLKSGDVISSVDGERIRTVSGLREKLAAKKEGTSVKLGLLRNKSEVSVNIDLPQPPKKQEHHLSERTDI